MHGCTTFNRAASRRRTTSAIAATAAAAAIVVTAAATASGAVPPRNNRWLDGDRPAPWPLEVVRFTDGPDLPIPSWTGRRLGPAPLHQWTSIWYVEVWRGNLDEDADPEFIVVLPYSSNGSIFPSRVEILDPLGSPADGSRPLAVQGVDGLDREARDVMDLDGDGHPEFCFSDMITAEAPQTVEGRRRNFFAMRPCRLQNGLLRDVSAELSGGPADGWYVGWVEREGEEPVCFATRIATDDPSDGPKRQALTLACLRAVGVLPAVARIGVAHDGSRRAL